MMESQVEMDSLERGTMEERQAAAKKLDYDSEKMKHPDVQKSGDSAYVGGDMGRYVNKLDVSAPLVSCCLGSGSFILLVAEVPLLHAFTASAPARHGWQGAVLGCSRRLAACP